MKGEIGNMSNKLDTLMAQREETMDEGQRMKHFDKREKVAHLRSLVACFNLHFS